MPDMDKITQDGFLEALPTFQQFSGVEDIARYCALPEDWALAVADVVDSTGAIARGKYKAVNMAGASVISAMMNALDNRELLFVFGGDGAVVAIPPDGIEKAKTAMAAVLRWVAQELDIEMRGALVPVSEIAANGLEVKVARYQASPDVSYAMFAGGGASWAEKQMKAGQFRIELAPEGTTPDLTGLSCRWSAIPARHGQIASIIVVPAQGSGGAGFAALVADITALLKTEARDGHPVPEQGPGYGFSVTGMEVETRITPVAGNRMKVRLSVIAQWLFVVIVDLLNRPIAGYDMRRYRAEVALNTDYRKFDDGLKLTVDIDEDLTGRLVERLDAATAEGVCRYGLHRQDSALMTCIVPSALRQDHMHFVDGAAGGYAEAAKQLRGTE